MSKAVDLAIALSLPTLVLLYLSAAPFTKVEESFNIQAIHDFLNYGLRISNGGKHLKENFDHVEFTGAVPRTFVGAAWISIVVAPYDWLVEGVHRQIFVRAVLGLYNALCLVAYRNALLRTFGRGTANWFVLLQASQYHIIFWSSRTLPNFFAFGFCTLALRGFLPRLEDPKFRGSDRAKRAILTERISVAILTILGIVFRSEIAVLLAAYTAFSLVSGRLTPLEVAISGGAGAVIGLLLTVPLDSFMWQHNHSFPLWPELQAFVYNVFKGKASDWGTMPWHSYFSASLPKLLFNPFVLVVCLPFAILNPALRPGTIQLLLPPTIFVAVLSFQPHKEWRFIVYAVPPFTAAAARSADWLWTRRTRSQNLTFLSYGVLASLLGSLAASGAMLGVSTLNYPGADALNHLHALVHGSLPAAKIHMDAAACSTGVTRFLQLPLWSTLISDERRKSGGGAVIFSAGGDGVVKQMVDTRWTYSKEEDAALHLSPAFWDGFDFVLTEQPDRLLGGPWELLATVHGVEGLEVLRPGQRSSFARVSPGTAVAPAAVRAWPFGEGPWELFLASFGAVGRGGVPGPKGGWWKGIETFARQSVTRGWWVGPRMVPKVHVLRRAAVEAE